MASQVNKIRPRKSKNRKNKVELVFDEEKRKEFLGGFRKRKLERKKKAQDDLVLELKSERKRLKQEARDSYKKLVVSHRSIPELDHLFSKEYEEDEVTVKVTEISTSEIATRNNWIGENRPQYEATENSEFENSEHENSGEEADYIPGMELKQKVEKNVKKEVVSKEFKTQKEIKKVLKKQATKNVQKSKAFQMKNKLEQQKNKKKSIRLKKERLKVRKQKNKVHGGKKQNFA